MLLYFHLVFVLLNASQYGYIEQLWPTGMLFRFLLGKQKQHRKMNKRRLIAFIGQKHQHHHNSSCHQPTSLWSFVFSSQHHWRHLWGLIFHVMLSVVWLVVCFVGWLISSLCFAFGRIYKRGKKCYSKLMSHTLHILLGVIQFTTHTLRRRSQKSQHSLFLVFKIVINKTNFRHFN